MDAQPYILANPSPWFTKTHTAGYRFQYRLDGTDEPYTLIIEAVHGDVVVGSADFVEPLAFGGGSSDPYCNNVMVSEDHRRQGIGNSLYILAELILGKALWDFWGGDPFQSAAGAALWAQSRRPFG